MKQLWRTHVAFCFLTVYRQWAPISFICMGITMRCESKSPSAVWFIERWKHFRMLFYAKMVRESSVFSFIHCLSGITVVTNGAWWNCFGQSGQSSIKRCESLRYDEFMFERIMDSSRSHYYCWLFTMAWRYFIMVHDIFKNILTFLFTISFLIFNF